jgi:hypothetical protein
MAARGLPSNPARYLFVHTRLSGRTLAMTSEQRTALESSLTHSVQEFLPDFVEACDADVDDVILHQDAFAADYQEDEYRLLGMAIKYAGLHGKNVHVVADSPNEP